MTTVYTLSEVAAHNTTKDCWLVIDGKVYDVTNFLEEHPGGDEVILSATGKDATQDFEDIGHSIVARDMMSTMLVGDIEPSSIPKKLQAADRSEYKKYNPDKSYEFIIRLLQFIVPLAILGVAVLSRFLTSKTDVEPEP